MGHEQRQDERYRVGLAARLSDEVAQSRAVTVTNVSTRGCRFNLIGEALEPGAALRMAFGRAGTVDARVKWRAGSAYGVGFDHPLQAVMLDHIRLFLSEEPALVAERHVISAFG